MAFKSKTWAALRRYIKMNPDEVSDWDIYRAGHYRFPAPGSQGGANHDQAALHPPAYKPPVSSASNLAKNYYFSRDQRRTDLGVPEIFAGESAKALPGPAPAAGASVPAPAAGASVPAPGPPTPGTPFQWKPSPVSDYATRYL